MTARNAVFGALCALLPAFPAMAQQPPGPVAQIVFQEVKSGATKQYEAGRKKHMAWHKSQKDTWTWYVWEVITGQDTGSYIVGTFGHAWKDFDGREKFEQADIADLSVNVGPSVSHDVDRVYIERADMSLSPSTASSTPAPMVSVTAFSLRPEGVNDFIDAVKKINEGIKKTNYPQPGASRWYQLINGGEVPLYVLVGDRATWSAFQPNDKSLDAMMEEAYGKEQGAAILAAGRKAIKSQVTSASKYRPDLSYIPEKK
ncbi:MAG TPA: hypothetical protein VK454_09705 [Myxococcaceae bacterium]|nr:hypothetical protein [Myxococcaceae bacterium]